MPQHVDEFCAPQHADEFCAGLKGGRRRKRGTHLCDLMRSRSDQDTHPLLLGAKRPLLRPDKLVTQAKQVQFVCQRQHCPFRGVTDYLTPPQLGVVADTPHLYVAVNRRHDH